MSFLARLLLKTAPLCSKLEGTTHILKPKPDRKHSKASIEPVGEPHSAGSPSHDALVPLSTKKKVLFTIVGFVLLPLLVLVVAEFALRAGGYGYSSSFFKPITIGNEAMLVENEKFGLRFFPPEMARSPAPTVMRAHKQPGTYRIFILGESAALGDPRPAFGAPRYLEKLLAARYPSTRFEVVCTAMTAINSHAILPIARECAGHEGDLWLIYMGNNEMVGPFGAATVFGTRAPSTASARLILAVQATRLGQFLMAAARKISGRSSGTLEWKGMNMFLQNQVGPRDPRREIVYRNFTKNLEDILKTGRRAGVSVLLNTVSVNLKDSAPFASLPDATGDALAEAQRAITNGAAAEARGETAEARKWYEKAVTAADGDAEAHFRYARSLLRSGEAEAARHFQAACDLDALPFRADSRINSIIREVANRNTRSGMVFFDAAQWVATNSPSSVPGEEIFYEHVHFTPGGNYQLGLAWAEQIAKLLPPAITANARKGWIGHEACDASLGLSDWNLDAVGRDVLRRLAEPPFTHQSNHGEQVSNLRTRLADIRKQIEAADTNAVLAAYVRELKNSSEDFRFRESFAEFLEGVGNLQEAITQWDAVRSLLPHHHVAYYHCGRLAMRQGNLNLAEERLNQAVTLRPDLAEGWLNLGQIQALRGKDQEAISYYQRELSLAPGDHRAYYHMGKAYSKLGRSEEAIRHLRTAIQLRPSYWEAHYALGEELAFSGQTKAAREKFEEVLRLKPDYAMAHFNLAVAQIASGDRAAGVKHLEEVLRLDPSNKQASEYLRKLSQLRR